MGQGGIASEAQKGEIVNWTQLATEFNIPGSNRGQTVKEIAAENSVDTSQVDQRPESG